MALLPGITAFLQSGVVEFPAATQHECHRLLLLLSWEEFILEGLVESRRLHTESLAQMFFVSKVKGPESVNAVVSRGVQNGHRFREHYAHRSRLGIVVVIAVMLFMLYLIFRTSQDVLAGHVATVDGVADRYYDSSDGSPIYYVKVENRRFTVSRQAYNALVPGERYCVYYLLRSKRLASIEPSPK